MGRTCSYPHAGSPLLSRAWVEPAIPVLDPLSLCGGTRTCLSDSYVDRGGFRLLELPLLLRLYFRSTEDLYPVPMLLSSILIVVLLPAILAATFSYFGLHLPPPALAAETLDHLSRDSLTGLGHAFPSLAFHWIQISLFL